MVLPEILGENFMNKIIRIVLIHLDLFQNHATLAQNVLGIEDGVQHQIAEHVQRNRQVLVQNFYVEANAFFGGKRVHVSANRIHLPRNVLGGARLGPLEDHVLQEVRDPVSRAIFVPRSRPQPYPNRDRSDVLHGLGQHRQTVGQDLTLYVARFVNHRF